MQSKEIDVRAFCAAGLKTGGTESFSGFERLSGYCLSGTDVDWTVTGSLDPDQDSTCRLTLEVRTTVKLVCQRCLGEMSFAIDTRTGVLVAPTEEKADELEDGLDDFEMTDVIVSEDGKVDLAVLIEDEALLAIPSSPRHDKCENKQAAKLASGKPSPFDVLKGIKTAKK